MKKKIGLSTGALQDVHGTVDMLPFIKACGFDAVDISLEQGDVMKVYQGSDDEFESFFDRIRRKADEVGLVISQTHGRCATFSMDPEFAKQRREWIEKDYRATQILGCKYCVQHEINVFRVFNSAGRVLSTEEMQDLNYRVYSDFLQLAKQYDVVSCMETFGGRLETDYGRHLDTFGNPQELIKAYDRLKCDNLGLCFDCGHTNCGVNEGFPEVADVIHLLGDKINLLHLHDNNGLADEHRPPKVGTIDWPALFEALEDIHYTGVFNYELKLRMFGTDMVDAFVEFLGKYLRKFTDNHGNM